VSFGVLALATGAVVAALLWSDNGVVFEGGSQLFWTRSPWKELLLFLAMVLGMTSKYLWDLIEVRRSKNAVLRPDEPKVGIEFDVWDFVQPLLVSALVFVSVLSTIKDVTLMSFLFSFQNGFFWQSVLKQKAGPNLGRP
jgi:hypothetical protein